MTTPQEPAMGVSDEAVEATAMAIFEDQCPLDSWNAPMEDDERESWRDCARAALLAALPHMQPAGEAVAWVCGFCRKKYYENALCCDEQKNFRARLATPPQPSADAGDGELHRYAARYRWLRDESGNDIDAPFVCGVHGAPMGDDGWLTGELLDEAVDAAMNGANTGINRSREAAR